MSSWTGIDGATAGRSAAAEEVCSASCPSHRRRPSVVTGETATRATAIMACMWHRRKGCGKGLGGLQLCSPLRHASCTAPHPMAPLSAPLCRSMGGHGALVMALKNPGAFKSVSAFAPICNPTQVPWGQKAFAGYLGDGWQV